MSLNKNDPVPSLANKNRLLTPSITPTPPPPQKKKLPSLPQGVLKFTPVMEDFGISIAGILKLLRNVKPEKAAGPDKLKSILLKELSEEIAAIIQVIFERYIDTGKLPAEWCWPRSPHLQKGDKSSAANYRPISSLTCILCKMLEHIMASHMVKHLEKHDLLYDLQHGLKHSGEVLSKLKDIGYQATSLSTYDFSTLFTTLPHNLIKEKLLDLIERTFYKKEGELYLACNDKKAFFTSKDHYKGYQLWSCQNVCDALSFLLDNI